MPNNRELALFVWSAVAAGLVLLYSDLRAQLPGLFKIAAHPKIVLSLAALAAWVGLEVWFAAHLGWWNSTLATETGLWFLTSGLVLFFNVTEAFTKPHFLRRKAVATLQMTVLLEGYAGLVSFALLVELTLQPLAFILGAMAVVATRQDQYAPARRAVQSLLILVGLLILGNVTLTLAIHWSTTDSADLFRQIAAPVWLTLGVIPFIYVLAIYAGYDMAYARTNWEESRPDARRRAKLALALSFRNDVRGLYAFAGSWPTRLVEARSLDEARRVIKEYKETVR
jgi:hypothetical protein